MCDSKVSIVIPARNRREYLKRCLNSIFQQDYENFEVIVIDNDSSDGTIEIIRSDFKKVILIKNNKNMSVCTARNQGIVKSAGEYVWFLDSDTEVINQKCLSNMVMIMQEHSEIGAIGGELNLTSNDMGQMKRKFILKNGATRTSPINNNNPILLECDFLPTCNCLIRKELLIRLGGFDPAYFILGEDRELGYSISKIGLKNIIDYRTAVLHIHSLEDRKTDLFRSHKNRIRFVLKNLSLLNILLLPFYDFCYLFSPESIKILKKGDVNVTKHLSPALRAMLYSLSEKREKPFFIKLFIIGTIYIFNLLIAYAWNFLFILPILYTRLKKPNFLKSAGSRQFK